MINNYSDLMSAWPASVVLAPKLSRLTPSFAQVWDYERISPASAVGGTVKSIQGAIGEYLERRHFFNEIKTVSRKTLHEMMPSSSADAFLNAFVQTSSVGTDRISEHQFSTVHAFNAFTLEQVEIPAVMVALDNITASEDLGFYPRRDTCGCNCHIDLTEAINGALGELMERQSLLLYWLTGKANYELIPDGETGVNYVDELIKNLMAQGELRILDVTMPGAPGYAILTIYGTQNEHSTIKYSTGLSYAADLRTALNKSMIELWQSYICMYNFITGGYRFEDIIDRYQQHFMSCNTYSTYTELYQNTEYRFVPSRLSEQNSEHSVMNSVTDFLQEITPNLFIYYARDLLNDGMLWYTKALSPDLFLHMDNSVPLNIQNTIYSRGSGIQERESIMVPFP